MPSFHEFFIFKHISFQWYGWSNFHILHPWCSGTRCPLFWPSQLASIHYIELILHILGFINLLTRKYISFIFKCNIISFFSVSLFTPQIWKIKLFFKNVDYLHTIRLQWQNYFTNILATSVVNKTLLNRIILTIVLCAQRKFWPGT